MNAIKKAMILAAGFGKRVRPLSLIRPKPLFPVLGRPLISHTLDLLTKAGIKEVVVNTHHLAAQVEDYLTSLKFGPAIHVIREENILGTGGGVKNASDLLGPEPFFIINADNLIDIDLQAVVTEHLAHQTPATLVLSDRRNFSNVAVDQGGMIRGFRGDWPAGTETDQWRILAFTGVHVLGPEVPAEIPEGPGDIITTYQAMVKKGAPVKAFTAQDPDWWDIGTLNRYLRVHSDLLAGRAKGPIMVGSGASISPGAVIEGWAYIGEGAIVEHGAHVKNSVLWPGSKVVSGVWVEDSVLADGVTAERNVTKEALI
ncbi:MAG: NDP-sugar synthase [Thermodesulfobacteriota bacterium]|nr:NDP-sugar synthase [Thermodesulfobacteriota bacterium]